MSDITISPVEKDEIARARADPTQEKNELLLSYEIENITISANSSLTVECNFGESFNTIPFVNNAYDFKLNGGNKFRLIPQTVEINNNSFTIFFNNLRESEIDIDKVNIKSTVVSN